MNFCTLAGATNGPIGPHGIALSSHTLNRLAHHQFDTFVRTRVDWTVDAIHVVIGAMLSQNERVSDYLGFGYPDSFSRSKLRTETDGERKTLLFRARYMLKSFNQVLDHDELFELTHIAALADNFRIFYECAKQVVGVAPLQPLLENARRFESLWRRHGHDGSSAEDERHELSAIIDAVEPAFEKLRDAFRAVEARQLAECERRDKQTEALEGMHQELGAMNRNLKTFNRNCTAVAVRVGALECEDPYSQMTGLDRCNAAQREMLLTTFRYSHEHFPMKRGAKDGVHTFRNLARVVWHKNRERFEALAKLPVCGYKNADSLGVKLCKLAKHHPLANHFRWEN